MVNALEWLITAKDETKGALDQFSGSLEKAKSKMDAVKLGATVMGGAVLAAAGFLGKNAVDEYNKGEDVQKALEEAYKRFPKLADENIGALQRLNIATEAKTGVDHNDIAVAEAKLAMFNLTGKQVAALAPIVVDYSERTGQSMTAASSNIGRALEGQTRALKAVGINLPSATVGQLQLIAAQNGAAAATDNLTRKQQALADLQAKAEKGGKGAPGPEKLAAATEAVALAQNKVAAASAKVADVQKKAGVNADRFGAILSGLRAKVGGYATGEAQTAAGQTRILNQQWTTMEESIGSVLVPVLNVLVAAANKVIGWLNKNPALVQALSIALGVLAVVIGVVTAALWLLALNPIVIVITLIIVAITLLVAAIIVLIMHWKEVVNVITGLWNKFCAFIAKTLNQMGEDWNATWADIGKRIQDAWNGFTKWVTNLWNGFVGYILKTLKQMGDKWNGTWTGLGNQIKSIWNGFTSWVSSLWNGFISALERGLSRIGAAWNGLWGGFGGIVRGAFNGVIGFIQGAINNVIGLVNGAIGAINSVGGAVGIHIGKLPKVTLAHFADGGVSGGGLAMVGERGPEVVNLPAGARVTPNGGVITVQLTPESARMVAQYLIPGIQYHAGDVASGLLDAVFS
jgi:hypothetical protein